MTDVGVDYSWGRPNLDEVWAAGYRFVLRYISYDTTGKNITPAELSALLGKGFEVCLNWEQQATDALGGAATGAKHANSAVHMAQALGYPAGCTIPFSVDFDATDAQLAGPITAWAQAAGPIVRAAGYRFGVYGSYRTIKYLFDHGLIDDGWQTYAWSHGQWDPRAALRQDRNGITVGGSSDCDHNTRVGPTYFMHPAGQSTQEDDMPTYGVLPAPDGTVYEIAPGFAPRALTKPDWDLAQRLYPASNAAHPMPVTHDEIARLTAVAQGQGGSAGVPPHTHDQPSTTGPVASPAQPAA